MAGRSGEVYGEITRRNADLADQFVDEIIAQWGYLGVFFGIIATGLGFPMPEELPVIIGGGLASHGKVRWWVMLPVCIVGVIIGDSCLYFIGRLWGAKLVERPFFQRHFLTPERLSKITENFHKYGIKILLFARLTPGIRAPIFITAGITQLSLPRFLIADGIYAIPGVSLLFFLGFWFTDRMMQIIDDKNKIVNVLILVAIVAVTGYFLYRFLRKPMVTGSPNEVPRIMEPVSYGVDQVTGKMLHPESNVATKAPIVAETETTSANVPPAS